MINVTCHECLTVAQVPDEAEGSRGTCMNCGARVEVPIVNRKLCTVCAKDVTGEKRAKDNRGNYYCVDCVRSSPIARNALAASKSDGPVCTACGKTFEPHQLLSNGGRPICKGCFGQQIANRAQRASTVEEKSDAPAKAECPICHLNSLVENMLDTGGRKVCRNCYISLFGGRGATDTPNDAPPAAAKTSLWKKIRKS